jgi:hypothetical protein
MFQDLSKVRSTDRQPGSSKACPGLIAASHLPATYLISRRLRPTSVFTAYRRGQAGKLNYIRREFWHYQKDDGLTWDSAMQQIKSGPAATKAGTLVHDEIIGLNDRDSNTGGRVSEIEKRLVLYKFLAPEKADGVFDEFTRAAVIGFQAANGLSQDGIVGPLTWEKLEAE